MQLNELIRTLPEHTKVFLFCPRSKRYYSHGERESFLRKINRKSAGEKKVLYMSYGDGVVFFELEVH